MAGDPFLSDPSKKRKRSSKPNSILKKSRTFAQPNSANSVGRDESDEEITSESEEEGGKQGNAGDSDDNETGAAENLDSDEEFVEESAADKRRRLAKQYLENLKNETEVGDDFDAKDLDDDIISRRLQSDSAETKGYVYRFIGDKISGQTDDVKKVMTRVGSKNLTGVAVRYPFLYTVSKDAELIKWDISDLHKKPKRTKHTKGGFKFYNLRQNVKNNHHYGAINCVAASPDGRFVVTGGADARLIIWSTENLSCLKVLETRKAVNAIAFRRNTDQLYAACADLRVKTFSINQFAQLEVLYGHQDNIVDISTLSKETCVSVGSRDKTALFWKIAEESRLTFRGGDSSEKISRRSKLGEESKEDSKIFVEGSIEVVSMVDESHFVTGSDNGNISLWSLAKKKPLFTKRLAHGLQPELKPSLASAEISDSLSSRQIPEQQPYWITAIYAVPYSDLFVSGSFDGTIRIWKVSQEGLRSFELIGCVEDVKGCTVGIDSAEIKNKKLYLYILTSKEHRLGRWFSKIDGGRNSLVSIEFDI